MNATLVLFIFPQVYFIILAHKALCDMFIFSHPLYNTKWFIVLLTTQIYHAFVHAVPSTNTPPRGTSIYTSKTPTQAHLPLKGFQTPFNIYPITTLPIS